MTVTPEMIESALKATDFAIGPTSKRWMKKAINAALAAQAQSGGYWTWEETYTSTPDVWHRQFDNEKPTITAGIRGVTYLIPAARAQSGETPPPRDWPDPLKSPQAEAIRNGKIDDVDIVALFDAMEREIRVHRGTFCVEAGLTHTQPPQTHLEDRP